MMFGPLLSTFCVLLTWLQLSQAMGPARLAEMRKATVEVFKHGFNNYMEHAFPEDELRPISCTPLTRDPSNAANYDLNDVLGNYSLTLIDSLSTLAILATTPSDEETSTWALQQFHSGVEKYVEYYGDGRAGPSGQGLRAHGFDIDSKVQVFETVIRGVGGLLSAHLFAIGELPMTGFGPHEPGHANPEQGPDPLEVPPIQWPSGFQYDGQLLRLAFDLSERLLPAFYTKTGLPYPRVNLRHGIPFYVNSPLNKASPGDPDTYSTRPEKTDTCSAGAGSLVLEFTVLSRLSGDPRFEHLAKRAFWAVWKSKSDIGLIGNAIDPEKGHWVSYDTGIGAGVDSFFEYALKSHILLSGHDQPNVTMPQPRGDKRWLDPNMLHSEPLTPEEHTSGAFLEAWHHAHAAIKRHLFNDVHHPYYTTGHRTRGYPLTAWVDSLAAFYPGLLAMAGEVEEGQEANLLYTALWTRYGALPERWSVRERQVDSGIGWWPGRPEFIESTYYLYRATNDPWHLHVGEMVLADIDRLCKTSCGWSGLQNVDTGEKADRMQSFFLGETTKYLFLLFDPDHPLNKLDKAFVFSTEAHPLIIPRGGPQHGGSSPQQSLHDQRVKDVAVYYDEEYTNTCPAPEKTMPLTGSALAARPDVFHAASFVNLHKTANPRSGVEILAGSKGENDTIFRYRENHTVFPWTLPPSMLPDDGTCAALAFKPTILIEFPATNQNGGHFSGSALNQLLANAAAFKTPLGAKIHSLNGLRVTFVEEDTYEPGPEQVWRVTQVNHISLGKDELVHVDADLLAGMNEPLFNRVRFPSYADLVIVHEDAPDENATMENMAGTDPSFEVYMEEVEGNIAEEAQGGGDIHMASEDTESWAEAGEADATGKSRLYPSYRSMLKSFVRAVTSAFDPLATSGPDGQKPRPPKRTLHSETYKASLPVGKGAVPLPDMRDAPLIQPGDLVPDDNGNPPAAGASLPWTTIFLAEEGCDEKLPDDAPRNHHVIVFRRGGCSFSEKLANIPAFTPSAQSLQLVIIVDDTELVDDDTFDALLDAYDLDVLAEDLLGMVYGGQANRQPWEVASDMIRPHLEEEQRTPGGIPRHRPVSMVMIRGGRGLVVDDAETGGGGQGGPDDNPPGRISEGAYEQLKRAKGVGIRRKYFIETQGRRVDNIIVL